MARIRIGLALGSGGARGWAHLGVLKAIDKLGLVPHVVAGSSIGSLVGGFYLAGHADALEEWARGLTTLKMLRYLKLPLSGGMISGTRLFNQADRLWVMVCGWPRYVTNTLIGATVNKAAQMEQIHAEDIADGGPMPGPVRIYFS